MSVNPVLILVLSILITFIILIHFLSPKATLVNIGPSGVFPITTKHTDFIDEAINILNSPRFTLGFFINPSLSSQQVTISNQFIPSVVNFNGAWSIDFSGSPDAASNNSSYIQLTVTQNNYQSPSSSSSTPLQQIPLQKWTHVAIVRDSRRITIYYNGVTIYSFIYENPISKGGSLEFGNSSAYITGNFTNITLNTAVSNVEDIKALYTSLSDINGMPYTASTIKFPTLSELVSINSSLPVPNFLAAVPPPGSTWTSYYA